MTVLCSSVINLRAYFWWNKILRTHKHLQFISVKEYLNFLYSSLPSVQTSGQDYLSALPKKLSCTIHQKDSTNSNSYIDTRIHRYIDMRVCWTEILSPIYTHFLAYQNTWSTLSDAQSKHADSNLQQKKQPAVLFIKQHLSVHQQFSNIFWISSIN